LTKHYIYIKKEFMKHILNNLTEQEKRAILEQHTGGMKVMTEKFSKLIESKLGDVKPILSEQSQKDLNKVQFKPDVANMGGRKLFDKEKSTFKKVVNFLKQSGINGYKFLEGIEGNESLGVILELPQDRSSNMWVEPNGEYLVSKKGKGIEKGKWNWDGMKLTLVAQPGAAKNTQTSVNEQITEPQSMQQLRQDQRADLQQKRADLQQTRQDNRAIRQQTRQDNRAIRQQTRQDNRAVRRDARAEQAAVTDIMNLRTEFNTLMTNLEALSRHQNTETYKNFLDLINNTAASLKGFVDSTANAGQAPASEDFQ
jgi:hypothetical protein